MRIDRTWMPCLVAAAVALAVTVVTPAVASNAKTIAVLGTHFQNDNEMYEPTSASERARLEQVGEALAKALANSGQFEVKPVPQPMAAKIETGQPLGECGGCELDFGASLGVDEIAWINVQKVSHPQPERLYRRREDRKDDVRAQCRHPWQYGRKLVTQSRLSFKKLPLAQPRLNRPRASDGNVS